MLEFKHALRICVWELTVNKLVDIIFEPDQRYLVLEIAGYPYMTNGKWHDRMRRKQFSTADMMACEILHHLLKVTSHDERAF